MQFSKGRLATTRTRSVSRKVDPLSTSIHRTGGDTAALRINTETLSDVDDKQSRRDGRKRKLKK